MSLLKAKAIDPLRCPKISFINEPGDDQDGVRREFFSIAVTSLLHHKDYAMFEGQTNHLIPVNDADLLSSNLFQHAGFLIAYSVKYGSIGLPGISRSIIPFLLNPTRSIEDLELVIEDVPDLYERQLIRSVRFFFQSKDRLKSLRLQYVYPFSAWWSHMYTFFLKAGLRVDYYKNFKMVFNFCTHVTTRRWRGTLNFH